MVSNKQATVHCGQTTPLCSICPEDIAPNVLWYVAMQLCKPILWSHVLFGEKVLCHCSLSKQAIHVHTLSYFTDINIHLLMIFVFWKWTPNCLQFTGRTVRFSYQINARHTT